MKKMVMVTLALALTAYGSNYLMGQAISSISVEGASRGVYISNVSISDQVDTYSIRTQSINNEVSPTTSHSSGWHEALEISNFTKTLDFKADPLPVSQSHRPVDFLKVGQTIWIDYELFQTTVKTYQKYDCSGTNKGKVRTANVYSKASELNKAKDVETSGNNAVLKIGNQTFALAKDGHRFFYRIDSKDCLDDLTSALVANNGKASVTVNVKYKSNGTYGTSGYGSYCDGKPISYSYGGSTSNVTVEISFPTRSEPAIADALFITYKGAVKGHTAPLSEDVVTLNTCDFDGLLVNFYSDDVFDFYYDRAQCVVSLENASGALKSATKNSDITPSTGILVNLGEAIENNDVLTIQLFDKLAKRITKTFAYKLRVSLSLPYTPFKTTPGKSFCANHTEWYFSQNFQGDYALSNVSAPAKSQGNGEYSIPISASKVNYTYTYKSGCKATVSYDIPQRQSTITPPSLTRTRELACNDEDVSIKVLYHTSNYTYQWKVNGVEVVGFNATELSKSHLNNGASGSYDITATAVTAHNGGYCYSTVSNTVNVKLHTLKPDLTFSGILRCHDGATFNLYDQLSGTDKDNILGNQGGYTYSLSTPAGLSINSGMVTPAQSTVGDHTATLTVSQEGCSIEKTAQVSILAIPSVPTLSPSRHLACNAEDVAITASNSKNVASYRWSVNGSTIPTNGGNVLNKLYLSQGTNSIAATAVLANGCTRLSDPVSVKLHTLNPNLNFASDTRCSNAADVDLTSLLSGTDKGSILANQDGYTYAFSTPAGLSRSGNSISTAQSTAGSYAATLTVSQEGCSIQKAATLTLLPLFATPVLSASTTHFCDDGVSDVTLTLNNYGELSSTPKSYIVTNNGATSPWPASTPTYTLNPHKGSDGTATQLSVSITEQSTGCTLTSNTVDVRYYAAPRRPNLSGKFNYCGSDTYTTLLHDNPEYHVQYWLYDMTKGANTLKMHKGANFWIFRPDQHPEQTPGSGIINTEAYHDLSLSAGRYEIRAPHDHNGCITTAAFEVTNFDNVQYQLLGLDNLLHTCNSNTDGVHVLSLFKDSDFKTALINEENSDLQYIWTATHATSSAQLPAMRNGRYLSVANAAPGTYSVTVTLSYNGCHRTFLTELEVDDRPAAFTISSSTSLACDSLPVTFTASNASVAGLTYKWYVDNMEQAGSTESTASLVLADGAHKVHAEAADKGGCFIASSRAAVEAWTAKTNITMQSSAISECERDAPLDLYTYLVGDAADLERLKDEHNDKGLSFAFSGMTVRYNATRHHLLDFADNRAKSNGDPYRLKFEVWQNDHSGCKRTYERNVKVLPRPAAFTLSPANSLACNSDDVTITASNNAVSGLAWDWTVNGKAVDGFHGGTLEKDKLEPGTNSVIAVARNESGCATQSGNAVGASLYVLNPDVSFTVATASYCTSAAKFSLLDLLGGADKGRVLSGEDGYTYELVYSGLSVNNDFGKLEVDPAQSAPRDYAVTLKVLQGGCSIEKSMTITILPTPAAFTLSATNSLACNSEEVTITASNSSVSGLTWSWEVNGTAVNGVNSATLGKAYLSQGSNSITATATNSSGCSSVSSAIPVTLHTISPDVHFTSATASFCTSAAKFSLLDLLGGTDKGRVLSGEDGYTYELVCEGLSVNNNFGRYEVDPSQSAPRDYSIMLKIAHGGCSVEKSMTITILPTPATFTLSATNALTCNSDNVTVTASNSSVSGLTWMWKVNDVGVGGVSGATLGKAYLTNGNNSITATATNGSGCTVSASNIATTQLHTLQPAVAWGQNSIDVCQNATAFNLPNTYLTGDDRDAVLGQQQGMTYSISGSGLALSGDMLTPATSTEGSHTITLTVSRAGCSVSFDTKVNINPAPAQFTIATTVPSQVLNDVTTHLLCNASNFAMATSALRSTETVQWYANGKLASATTNGNHTYAMNADGVATMSAIAVSSKGCTTPSTNTLRVERRTVDFSAMAVNTQPITYCNGDDNVNFFTFVTAANKEEIEGSSNGWSYTLDGNGISQCGGENNLKMLCPRNSAPAPYNTKFKVTKNGCSANWSKVITVKPVPETTMLTANTNSLCTSGTASMTATTQNYLNSYTYNWYKNDTLNHSGSTNRTENYTAEDGVGKTTWKVAAVDNGCTGAMSNEVTIRNNQPTMTAAFTKPSFASAERLQIKFDNMINVDANSIEFTTTNSSNGSTVPRPIYSIKGNIYSIEIAGGIGAAQTHDVYVNFKDNNDGQCHNNISIGQIRRTSTTYTIISGKVQSAAPKSVEQKITTTATAMNYDGEAERLYREYVAGLRRDEHKAFLAPTYTSTNESAKLLIYSAQAERATVSVTNSMGGVVSRREVALYGGITETWLEAHEKPQTMGMYYVVIEYANGKRETLKGITR